MRSRITLLSLICLWALPASAQECTKKLRLMASLPMTQIGNGGQVTIPVGFNGVEKRFLLDTGGIAMQVSSKIADELKLPQVQSRLGLYSATGDVSRNMTRVKDFTLGAMRAPSLEVQVSDHGDLDGLFVPLGWRAFDFAGGKMNIFSKDHCEGKVVYWPAQALAVVPIVFRGGQITVPVTIDGRTLTAVIDTGATSTIMRLDTARRAFDLDPDDMKKPAS